ncbi:MAG: hypothetical protein CMJ25_17835 [Phycisphaerae bacterium]|nr:hypothetical protein [Phycisphaerae bacterium]
MIVEPLSYFLTISIYIICIVGFYKVRMANQRAKFWKDSCFVMAEKYNDLLVKTELSKAIESFKVD